MGGGAAAADAHALNALALEASGRLPSSAHGAALTSTDLAAMQARNGGDVGLGRLGAAEAHLSSPLPPPAQGTSDLDSALASAMAASLMPQEDAAAAAAASRAASAASGPPAAGSGPIVGILRTKWPGVAVYWDGSAPSLD